MLSRETVDQLAAIGLAFEEIDQIKMGMADVRAGRVVSFENAVKIIKNGNAVCYV